MPKSKMFVFEFVKGAKALASLAPLSVPVWES